MKFLITLVTFFLSFALCFGSDQVRVSVGKREVLLGENFKLEILLDSSDLPRSNIELQITGIENFDIFSRNQGLSYENINGQTRSISQYILDFQTISIGEFDLGPVTVVTASGSILDDETFTISVLSESEGITNSYNTGTGNINSEQNNLSLPEEGIKGMRFVKFPLHIILLGISIFIILLYIIISLLFSRKQNHSEQQSETEKPGMLHQEKITQYFYDLQKQNKTLSSQEFFKKYNIGVKEIFTLQGIRNSKKATLQEIAKYSNITESSVFQIFKKSYKHEYSGVNISPETRQKYIEDILLHIKK